MTYVDVRSGALVAFKYRLRSLLVISIAVLAAVAACIVMQRQYEATAQLMVKIGREIVYRPDVGSTQAALPTIDKDELIASNIAIMKNTDLALQVMEKVGIERLFPKLVHPELENPVSRFVETKMGEVKDWLGLPEESVQRRALLMFGRKLRIDPVKKTNLVAVSFLHPDPEVAAQVANLVVATFQQKSGALYANSNLDFVQGRVDADRAALADAEGRLNEFRRKFGVYAFDTQTDMLLKQKMDIDSGLKSADARAAELQGLVEALLVQRSATPQQVKLYSETERHKSIDDTQGQLLTLQLQERQLASRFSDNYEPLIGIRKQIQLAQAALSAGRGDAGSHSRSGINETYQQLNQETLRRQAELRSVAERRDAMQVQVRDIDAQVAVLSSRQAALLDLQRDVELRSQAVRTGYDKLVEARIVDGLNQQKPASFNLVQAASPPERSEPARPLPLLYTAGALVAGIVLSICITFFSYRMSGTFVTAEQAARALNMPVLAVFNEERGRRRLGRTRAPELGYADRLGETGRIATA